MYWSHSTSLNQAYNVSRQGPGGQTRVHNRYNFPLLCATVSYCGGWEIGFRVLKDTKICDAASR